MISIYHSTARSQELSRLDKFRVGSWIHATAPSTEELEKLAEDFNLDIALLNDAMDLYEAPRIERDDESIYVYTRYYHPDNGVINATEPMLVIYHPDCLITILRVEGAVLQKMTTGVEKIITTQKTKLLLQVLAASNRSYQIYVNKTTRHILSVRSELKRKDMSSEVLLGLIDVEDDMNEFLSALQPQAALLRNIMAGKFIRLYEEDRDLTEDISLETNELIELVKSRLITIVNIRQVYDAIAASELNKTFKRLTSINIFMTIPTITAGLYGMNLVLPLQKNPNAFWFILLIVMSVTATVIYYFQKKRWL